jgi:hypothetical protein
VPQDIARLQAEFLYRLPSIIVFYYRFTRQISVWVEGGSITDVLELENLQPNPALDLVPLYPFTAILMEDIDTPTDLEASLRDPKCPRTSPVSKQNFSTDFILP